VTYRAGAERNGSGSAPSPKSCAAADWPLPRRRRAIRRVDGLAFAAALMLAASSADAARTEWREMTIGHFHLYSTLGDSATRDIARHLQAFEQTVMAVLQTDDRLPDIPTEIYILRRDDFRNYTIDDRNAGGFFAGREYANFLVIDGNADFGFVKTAVFHEYTHFVQQTTSTIRYPPWYMEGYAELFSAFRLNNDVVTVGEVPSNVGMSLNAHDWIPIERILAVKMDDPEYRAERLVPQFYGEAWALVHYLLFDDAKLTAPTYRYLINVDLGFPEPEAFAHAFPLDKAGLDAAVRKLLQNRTIRIQHLSFPHAPAIDEAQLTRLTAAQADLGLARLCFDLGRPKQIVAPLIAAALAGSPGDPAARALAARIAARAGAPIDVDDLIGSLGSGTDLPRVRMDLADALVLDGHSTVAGEKAAALLDGLVHAAAPPIEAVLLWAHAAMAARAAPASVVAVLEPAQARVPHNVEILRLLAIGSEMLGNRAKARDYYTRLILVGPTAEYRAWAVKEADSARLQDPPAAKR
jgi:hypothetical protein